MNPHASNCTHLPAESPTSSTASIASFWAYRNGIRKRSRSTITISLRGAKLLIVLGQNIMSWQGKLARGRETSGRCLTADSVRSQQHTSIPGEQTTSLADIARSIRSSDCLKPRRHRQHRQGGHLQHRGNQRLGLFTRVYGTLCIGLPWLVLPALPYLALPLPPHIAESVETTWQRLGVQRRGGGGGVRIATFRALTGNRSGQRS